MCACMELLIAFRCTCTMTIKLSILFYSNNISSEKYTFYLHNLQSVIVSDL